LYLIIIIVIVVVVVVVVVVVTSSQKSDDRLELRETNWNIDFLFTCNSGGDFI